MALRFSYRINAEALNQCSARINRQSDLSPDGSEPSNANQSLHHTKQSMQESPPSCIDLLTSF
jgi:hypothetical protein